MGFLSPLRGEKPGPLLLDQVEVSALFDVLGAIKSWDRMLGYGLPAVKTARRNHRPVLDRLHRRLLKTGASLGVQGLSGCDRLAVLEACAPIRADEWEPDGQGYYDIALPKHDEAWVARERLAHRLGLATACSACGQPIVPSAEPDARNGFDHGEVARLVRLLLADRCASCQEAAEKDERVTAEADRAERARTDSHRRERYRAATSLSADLVREEIEILHDLLALFVASDKELPELELRRRYVEWWFENQTVARDLVERLKGLDNSRVVTPEQAAQLCVLLATAGDRLDNGRWSSQAPLLPAEISARLRLGYDLVVWHTEEMRIVCSPLTTPGRIVRECFAALETALSAAPATTHPRKEG